MTMIPAAISSAITTGIAVCIICSAFRNNSANTAWGDASSRLAPCILAQFVFVAALRDDGFGGELARLALWPGRLFFAGGLVGTTNMH